MAVYVDTSAVLALLAARDQNHDEALVTWQDPIAAQEELVCSSYVLIETFALVQSRLGMDAVQALQTDARPALTVVWVTQEIHEAGVTQRCRFPGGRGSCRAVSSADPARQEPRPPGSSGADGLEPTPVGVTALLAAGHRQLSLVDCVSFEVMRREGIRRVFAFDAHFADHGFDTIPPIP